MTAFIANKFIDDFAPRLKSIVLQSKKNRWTSYMCFN